MDKILVTIYVLAIEEEYDILLPIGLKMQDALKLIEDTIVDLTNGAYVSPGNAVLYNTDGSIINLNNTVKFSGLTNGVKLLLR